MISYIIPSHNNLRHLKNVYESIQRNSPEAEIIILDDVSSDGTWEWIQEKDVIRYRSEQRVGHTILYDKGVELATNDIVGILHADMIIAPNYTQNILKHLKRGTVVCGTRIEPPLHPQGNEKIIQDFGMDFDTLDIDGFENFSLQHQRTYQDSTTHGMFAPWVIFKEDFQRIGGHDPLFAPFPYEDSDIFQRWILAGYKLIQSRDAFVYHLTCRGHRWTDKIGEDDDYFSKMEKRARWNYIRKWGSWIRNDEYQHPIIPPVYNKGLELVNSTPYLLEVLEPWFHTIKTDLSGKELEDTLDKIQSTTQIDILSKIKSNLSDEPIVIKIDGNLFGNEHYKFIQNINYILQQNGDVGKFELGNIFIEVRELMDVVNNLIYVKDERTT